MSKSRTFNLKTKYGLNLDGVNEYINTDNILQPLNGTTKGTWSCWIYMPTAATGASNVMISFGENAASGIDSLSFGIDSAGKATYVAQLNGSARCSLITTSQVVFDNTWVHMALVQDGTSPVIYVDGVAVAQSFSVSTDKTAWFNTSGFTTISLGSIGAYRRTTPSSYFAGRMANVGYWDTDLSAAQILEITKGGNRIDLNAHSASANLVAFSRPGNASGLYDGTNWIVPNYKGRLERKKSILFDGVNETCNIDAVLTPLATTTQGTWSAWVKLVSISGSLDAIILAFGDTDGPNQIRLSARASTRLARIQCTISGADQWLLDTNSAAFPIGSWVHVALVQDGTSPVVYINGTAVAQTFVTSTDKTKWFNDISALDNGRLGCWNKNSAGNANFLNGNICDVRLFDTALTSNQITALYNKGTPSEAIAPLTDTNLVANYPLGDAPLDTNTVIEDVKNNYDGTGVNLEAGDLEYDAPMNGYSVNMESTDLVAGNNII